MINAYRNLVILVAIVAILSSCKQDKSSISDRPTGPALFDLMDNKQVGIDFINTIADRPDFNVYLYRNYYNGGGVAIGDINNDGLQDVYMVSNQQKNKLYLNKGNWKFEDITERAGVGGNRVWSTGVTMADVNGDGLLDIYVCNSGGLKGESKENELFINKGNLAFVESAKEYGLNDEGFSTHASFFDYDKDGDLDCYVLNNSFQAIGSFNLRNNIRDKRDKLGGDKLYQNQNGKFVDVSAKAGIYGSVIGFGLGITVGDVNNDGWEDIYISNDFFERDYLYINKKNGTFSEELPSRITSTSAASMGADIADIDNDGYNDIFVTDMLPSSYERLKTVTTFDDWDRYEYGVSTGYHHQFTRNTLQHNNGDGTFSEISRYAGVEASDWSWGALFFDMDNDGRKDLFIANGIYRDLTDQDYLQYISNEQTMRGINSDPANKYKSLVEIIPSRPINNHVYKNHGDNRFKHYDNSGIDASGFSNGAAYGDLDNDGDLDLVVNNLNMPCFVYQNNANKQSGNSYLKFDLKGSAKNSSAIGSRIYITDTQSKDRYMYECQPTRGFESSMDKRINAGLGKSALVDVEVLWPSGKVTSMKNVKTNQTIALNEKDGIKVSPKPSDVPLATWSDISSSLPWKHVENSYIDFKVELLNYHMTSTQGPIVGMGDLNGDGTSDLICPGPLGTATQIFTQDVNGKYTFIPNTHLDLLKNAEHIESHLFDADGDKDLDAYITSGGHEVDPFSPLMNDILLINDGKGNMAPSNQKFPESGEAFSTGTVASGDIDADGDLDLFVGEKMVTGSYGKPCSGHIYINDGKGNFSDQTQEKGSTLMNIGMINDAILQDLNGDSFVDLVVVGECMPIKVFKNKKGKFEDVKLDQEWSGWANVVKAVDIDNDKDLDLVIGNHGLNSRFRASVDRPIGLFFNDFDNNGMPEGILCSTREDKQFYPYALRHNLMNRMPSLKKKYPNFTSFKNASMDSIFGKEILNQSILHKANELQSIVLVNEGNFKFSKKYLPSSVQYSVMYAIESLDINADGYMDLIMGGNLYGVQPEMGRYDASYGHILINDKKGNFSDMSRQYGFSIKGQIRDIKADKDRVYIFRNNDAPIIYKIK